VRAAIRWIRADLRARRGQAVAVVLVVAGVVSALLLSATLLEGATDPWRALFAQTKGADMWLRLSAGAKVRPLAGLDGVTGLAGPYQTTAATIVRRPVTEPVELWAMRPTMPAVGRPLLRQGSWLTGSRPSGVVVEASFAQTIGVGVGTRLVIEGLDGSSVTAAVIGIAYTSAQGFYPQQAPGLVWVMPQLLHRVEPIPKHTGEIVGLRLADPSAPVMRLIGDQAVTQLGSAVISVSTWLEVEQSMASEDPLLGALLALFGLVALGGALLAIGNAAGGWVLVQLPDLAMLKTLGFTPGQLVGMLLAENAALGLAGATAGIIGARLLMFPLLGPAPAGPLTAVAPLPAGWVALVAGGTELAVLLATILPGWRAGKVWPLSAIRPPAPAGRLSRLARAALLTHMPPAVVLGARAAFTRRLSAALTIAGLALPMAMITIGLGFWATLDSVQRHPGELGLAAALTLRAGQLDSSRAAQIIAADPDVAAAYRSVAVSTLLPGATSTITVLGAGSSARPYPFHVAAGRLYRAPQEAVASQGLLDAAGMPVGNRIRIAVNGVTVIFHIVGRIIEPEYNGLVLACGIDTLTQAGAVPPPPFYSLVLRPGISPAAAEARLLRASGGRLDVAQNANPAAPLGIVRPMLAGLFIILALIGLTSLLTASAVGLRDHLRNVGALRAMGLTPRQVLGSLMTSMGVLALFATVAGGACGFALSPRLINLAGQAYGIGTGLGSPPSMTATLAAAAGVLAAAGAVAIIPAHRAARTPVAAMLGP
jgi:putative ABC transport system permease protein